MNNIEMERLLQPYIHNDSKALYLMLRNFCNPETSMTEMTIDKISWHLRFESLNEFDLRTSSQPTYDDLYYSIGQLLATNMIKLLHVPKSPDIEKTIFYLPYFRLTNEHTSLEFILPNGKSIWDVKTTSGEQR